MKYILLFLLVPCFSHGQVFKFKTYGTQLTKYNGKEFVSQGTNRIGFLVVINIDKDKIQTYGKAEGDYDIVKKTGEDLKEDGSTYAYYDAVDGKGTKCKITLDVYGAAKIEENIEKGVIASLGILYGDYLLVFYLKKDE